jgi:hypothetical protein
VSSGPLAAARPVHHDGCSCARCVGFADGNLAALKHGATSERQIRPLARNHRRRVLRQIGLSPRDLDAIGRAHLEHYCRTTAKIVLIDRWLDEHGLIRDDGSLQPCMRLYVSLTNSARATLARLEEHLRKREADREFDFAAALAELGAGR